MAIAPAKWIDRTSGQFDNAETGKVFEYADLIEMPEIDDAYPSFPHVVFVGHGGEGYRYARVGKTVAYVVIDEDDYGEPVVEKWKIKNLKVWR
ncbi:MAG: hypothetical protein ACYDHF_08060 [Candidatus Cryosericum sp.]